MIWMKKGDPNDRNDMHESVPGAVANGWALIIEAA